LRALDARTGAIRWKRDSPIAEFDYPTMIDGALYVSVNADVVWHKHRPEENHQNYELVLDPATGQERRRILLPDCCVRQSPLVQGDALYLSTSTGVYAVRRATGAVQWWFPLEPELDENFVQVSGFVVPVHDSTVYALPTTENSGPLPGMPRTGRSGPVPGGLIALAGLLILAGMAVRRQKLAAT